MLVEFVELISRIFFFNGENLRNLVIIQCHTKQYGTMLISLYDYVFSSNSSLPVSSSIEILHTKMTFLPDKINYPFNNNNSEHL